MHNVSKYWSIKFMDANFLYHSIYDTFIQRQPKDSHMGASINFFFKKTSQELLTGFLPNFKECSLERGKKFLFTITEKSGLWSNTGAQAPLVSMWLKLSAFGKSGGARRKYTGGTGLLCCYSTDMSFWIKLYNKHNIGLKLGFGIAQHNQNTCKCIPMTDGKKILIWKKKNC